MTEQEYINLRDLQRLDSVLAILRDITPITSSVISDGRFREAIGIIADFRDRLYGEIEIKKEVLIEKPQK